MSEEKGQIMCARIFSVGLCALLLLLSSCSDIGTSPDNGDDSDGGTLPAISLGDLDGADEGSNATFVVTLNKTSSNAVTMQYTVVDLSTTDGDFTGALSGTATVPAGSLATNIVLAIADDGDPEGTELYQVVLSAPSQATLLKGTVLSRINASDGTADISFSGQIAPMLSAKGCAGCHGTNGNFSVSTVNSLLNTGDHKPNVIPGLGGQSNLFLKTTSTPPFGSQMPLGGPYLTTEEQNQIRAWIDQGAQDN